MEQPEPAASHGSMERPPQRVAAQLVRRSSDLKIDPSQFMIISNTPTTRKLWAGRISGGVLTFVSGYVSAATWTRYGTVGGPMTGNTIRFGVFMADGHWVR
jgi:hypothetical protein